MRVAVGGTFEFLHVGHRALLHRACVLAGGDTLTIGLTNDDFTRGKGVSRSFAERLRRLRAYLDRRYSSYVIEPLADTYGSAITDPSLRALVVSEETAPIARMINRIRKSRNMTPLFVSVEPLHYGEDLIKISSSRIRAGIIDERGKRKKPIRLVVGSTNPAKIRGVKRAASLLFPGIPVHVLSRNVASGVSAQPFGSETLSGAIHRAKNSWDSSADFAIGLESGIFLYRLPSQKKTLAIDCLWCAVYDGTSLLFGHSFGFPLPSWVIPHAKEGKELSELFELSKDSGGVVSWLSGKLLKRTQMVTEAVLCAFIPRIAQKEKHGSLLSFFSQKSASFCPEISFY